jgi:hypothetical protein
MALRKRGTSAKVIKAEKRLEAMKGINAAQGKSINYGGEQNPLSESEMRNSIDECLMLINEYNHLLELADAKAVQIKQAEEKLGDYYTRVLAGAKSIFGVDSDEVSALGGTKKSERRSFRK